VRLIRNETDASSEDLDQIAQWIASAPFSQRPVRVPDMD
jgi:hypothetical protein